MRSPLRRWAVAVIVVVVAPFALLDRAQADDGDEERGSVHVEAPHAPRRTVLVEGDLGMGAPLGWAGAALIVAPVEPLALHAGVGLGSQGVQISAGARGRYAVRKDDLVGLGVSWSSGRFAGVASSLAPLPEIAYQHPFTLYWRRAHFVNLDLSLEHDAGPVVFRPFIGLGYVVNGGDALELNTPCSPAYRSCSRGFARTLPYVGIAVAFGVL